MINDNLLIRWSMDFAYDSTSRESTGVSLRTSQSRKPKTMFPHTSFTTYLQLTGLQEDSRSQDLKVESVQQRLDETERQLGRTMLAVEALFEILVEKGLVTTAELFARIDEIDLRDGKMDGKISPVALECLECGRPVSSKSAKCMYCGEDRPRVAGITAG